MMFVAAFNHRLRTSRVKRVGDVDGAGERVRGSTDLSGLNALLEHQVPGISTIDGKSESKDPRISRFPPYIVKENGIPTDREKKLVRGRAGTEDAILMFLPNDPEERECGTT